MESESEHFVLNNDNRRNSVIVKVQDQMVVPSFKISSPPTVHILSDSDEENFVCKWMSCFR